MRVHSFPLVQVKKRDYRRRTNANYLALLKEQDDDIKKRDESMRKYYEFSTKVSTALASVTANLLSKGTRTFMFKGPPFFFLLNRGTPPE